MNQLLTAPLLARATLRLLERQVRDQPPFMSTVECRYDPRHLTWMLDIFCCRYLEEAADTMANLNFPFLIAPVLELPACVAAGRASFLGVTVRLIMAHDIWNDCDRMRIDATWSGVVSEC